MALRGGSSNHDAAARFRWLAEALPAVLRRRPRMTKRRKPRQMHRRLSPEHRDQLIDEYRAGASMLALAKRWKIHRTTVAEHLRRAGVETRRQGIPTEKLDEVITLYNHGWSCLQLAERYGCNAETVRTYLKGVGITFRKPWEKVR